MDEWSERQERRIAVRTELELRQAAITSALAQIDSRAVRGERFVELVTMLAAVTQALELMEISDEGIPVIVNRN